MGLIDELRSYMERLFPLNRSLTGEPNRETLRILREVVPLTMIEYPSGMKLYDEWTVPDEWNLHGGTISNDEGTIVGFYESNLHVCGYSIYVNRGWVDYDELIQHLHFLGDLPNVMPYKTLYYQDDWGFSISYDQFLRDFQPDKTYGVYIDAEKIRGSMTIGEFLIPGRYEQEYLVSTYICHPSMANDNTSGMVLTTFLARELGKRELNYSWRFVWVPETVGAIAYLFSNEAAMERVDCGLVVTCVAGPGQVGYKRSFDGGHRINGLIDRVLRGRGLHFATYPFDRHGSDERQYSSQGFRINCASIHSDKYYTYPEYHTSLDNLDFISYERLAEMLEIHVEVALEMDADLVYRNLQPRGEPFLSSYGMYPPMTDAGTTEVVLALLFDCDGTKPLSSLAAQLGLPVVKLHEVARRLVELGLLEEDCVRTCG